MAMKRADGQAVADTTELVVADENQVERVNMAAGMVLGGIDGDTEDIQDRHPYLKIHSGMGPHGEDFKKGSIVVGGDSCIAEATKPIRITFLSARFYWKEHSNDKYDPKRLFDICATAKEVEAKGGTTKRFANDGRTEYRRAVAALALIEKPESLISGYFGIELGGKQYAPVTWFTDKTVAEYLAPALLNELKWSLSKRGLYSGVFEMRTELKTYSTGNTTYIPRLKLVDFHPDNVIEEIKGKFASSLASPDPVSDIGE